MINDYAFPCDVTSPRYPGMTLREYFAAKAMQGLLSGAETELTIPGLASMAYCVADEMLKAAGDAPRPGSYGYG